jgi:hypothetical protein
MSATDQFTKVSKNEHRAIRDALLNLIQAFRNRRDLPGVRRYLIEAAALSGPHFRYEEEALYPALAAVLDDGQVRKLLSDHDRTIATVRNLVQLAALNELTHEDAHEGMCTARSLLPYVFECDGVSIMADLLPEGTVRQVLNRRRRSSEENLDLLRWADTTRLRAAVSPSA